MKTNIGNKPVVNLMFDTETFSTNREMGMVVSVAYKSFSFNEDYTDDFGGEIFINPNSSEFYGRIKDEETIKWWQDEKRSEAYAQLLSNLKNYGASFAASWSQLYREIRDAAKVYHLRVWSKGIDFDFPLIESCWKTLGFIQTPEDMPYNYWDKCDVRTVLTMAKQCGWHNESQPTAHDAYDDCRNQIKELQSAWDFIFNH